MHQFTSFLEPQHPQHLVGYKSFEQKFADILIHYRNNTLSERIVNSIVISGPAGIGKSSLLTFLGEFANKTMIKFIPIEVGLGKKSHKLIEDIYSAISPHLSEEKKGVFTRSKIEKIPKLTSDSKIEAINTFCENLNIKKVHRAILIGLDNLDRIPDTNQSFVLEALISLIRLLKGKYLILFISTCQDQNLPAMKELLEHSIRFHIEKLDDVDARLLISKVAHGTLQTSKSMQEELVKLSNQSPFNLMFNINVVTWAENKIMTDGLGITENTIMDLAKSYIKNFSLKAFIKEIYKMSEEENRVFHFFLSSPKNAVKKETLNTAGISKEAVNSLIFKKILLKSADYYQIASNALYNNLDIGLGTGVDLSSELILLLQILEEDSMMEYNLNPRVLERLEQASYSTERLDDRSIPDRGKKLFGVVFNKSKYFEAYRLAILTGNFLRMAQDVEGSGLFFENTAQFFYDVNKIDYSISLYQKSFEIFNSLQNKSKCREVAQKGALMYLEQAGNNQKLKYQELARVSYFHAIQLFIKAEDYNSASDTLKKVIKTYGDPIFNIFTGYA